MKLGISIVLLFLVGCSSFGTREPTPREVAQNIYNITRESTALALHTVHENQREVKLVVAEEIIKAVDRYALPLINDPERDLTQAGVDNLLTFLPSEYRGLMSVAFQTFRIHYESPNVSNVVSKQQLSYVKAFVLGIRAGAVKVLEE